MPKNPHFNELGTVHHRHRRLGFGKSHHLAGYPDDQSKQHTHEPNSADPSPGDAGFFPDPVETGPPCNQGDGKCYVFDDYDRTWTQPTIVTGASLGISASYGYIVEEMYGSSTDSGGSYGGTTVATGLSAFDGVTSAVGTTAFGHSSPPSWSTCTGLSFTFAGWQRKSSWLSFTMPAHVANVAGMTIELSSSILAKRSHMAGWSLSVFVGTSEPTEPQSGTYVGELDVGSAGTDVFIPLASLPAEGETCYILVSAGWDATYGDPNSCGSDWPYNTGVGDSGKASPSVVTLPVWNTFSGGDHDLGTTPDHGDADDGIDRTQPWWDGAINLNYLGNSGTPVAYGMTNGHIFVTADAPAGIHLSYEADGDADGAKDAPWSFDGWAYTQEFEVDVAAIATEDGPRRIRWRDISGNEVTATVYFGTPTQASGFGLDTGDGETFVAMSFSAATRYAVRVDTRGGKGRMRVWEVSSGEPAKWAIDIALGDGTNTGDRLEIDMLIGNGSANPDVTLTLYKLVACGTADDCYWLDQWLGTGDGETVSFFTPQRYARASLKVRVDGFWVTPSETDPYTGEFRMDHPPDPGAFMRAHYLVGTEADEG